VRPRRGRDLQGRYLSFAEREEIALGLARGESMRRLAVRRRWLPRGRVWSSAAVAEQHHGTVRIPPTNAPRSVVSPVQVIP